MPNLDKTLEEKNLYTNITQACGRKYSKNGSNSNIVTDNYAMQKNSKYNSYLFKIFLKLTG